MKQKITRYMDCELRSEGDSNVIEGNAVVFNRVADMGWFDEEIDPSAFQRTDMSDVVLNLNHDNNMIFAGTRNGSLELEVKETGVYQKSSIIDTTQGRDVLKLVKSGLIRSMSFAFTIADGGEYWETRNGREYRRITDIDRLYDVSLVVFPAYPQTWARANSDELAEKHKALMERRAEQEKRMKELVHD